MIRSFGISGAGGIRGGSGASSPVSTEIQSLVINLGDNDKNVRKQAVDTLMEVSQKTPKDVVLELKDSLKDSNEDVRVNASIVLEDISKVSPEAVIPAVPELKDFLKDSSEYICVIALIILVNISKVSPEAVIPAIPELRKALKDPNEKVRVIASYLLRRIGAEIYNYTVS